MELAEFLSAEGRPGSPAGGCREFVMRISSERGRKRPGLVRLALGKHRRIDRSPKIGRGVVVRILGKPFAIVPVEDRFCLERYLEWQEEKEKGQDRLDVEEAERRLDDPTDLIIPYEQVRRELGLEDL